jgi:DNA-directed RNA polymerase alpha subunit
MINKNLIFNDKEKFEDWFEKTVGVKPVESEDGVYTTVLAFVAKNAWQAALASKDEIEPDLSILITDLGLAVHSVNCLKSENINCLGDLIQCRELDLLKFPNFGPKALNDVKNVLALKGLTLKLNY